MNSRLYETTLEKNPFALLGATTRDDRRKILELSEERSFHIDPDLCTKARSDLTNPRSRVTAEVSWLPCLSPKRTADLLSTLRERTEQILHQNEIEPLARANLMASAFELLSTDLPTSSWIAWIISFTETYEQINPEKVLRHINEDRLVSGFPEVLDQDSVIKELSERRQHFNETIKRSLDTLSSSKLLEVVTGVVEQATKNGTQHAPTLVDDIIDKYHIETQGQLQSGADKIIQLLAAARVEAPSGENNILAIVTGIERTVKAWDRIAQPIQLSFKSRGLDHEASLELGFAIRNLAIDLANDFKMLTVPTRLTILLEEVFAELPDLHARIQDDLATLDEMNEEKRVRDSIELVATITDQALVKARNDPKQAKIIAEKLIKDTALSIEKMVTEGKAQVTVDEAKNYVAAALLQCVIAYGNETAKWPECLSLLESGRKLAIKTSLQSRYDDNIKTASENVSLFGTPCKSPPSLRTVNTVGFALYGATDHDHQTKSHIATYYFVVLMLPIFPIARYRVIQEGNSYRFLGKFPLRKFDKWHLAISLSGIALLFLFNM